MNKRRIFIAINLPEKIKKRLKEYQEKFDYLPVRWVKPDGLHLTLVFIGYVDNEQMLEACKIVREVGSHFEPFFINFKRVITGPPGKETRMIWVEGETNEDLTQLKKKLEEALLVGNSGLQKIETRVFNPHLTLARVRAGREAELAGVKEIKIDLPFQLEVSSIEVMESNLKYDGAEYATLESCELGDNL